MKNLPSSEPIVRSLTYVRDDKYVILTTVREEESLTKRASCHSERSGEKNLTFSETLTEQCHSERLCFEESPAKQEYNRHRYE